MHVEHCMGFICIVSNLYASWNIFSGAVACLFTKSLRRLLAVDALGHRLLISSHCKFVAGESQCRDRGPALPCVRAVGVAFDHRMDRRHKQIRRWRISPVQNHCVWPGAYQNLQCFRGFQISICELFVALKYGQYEVFGATERKILIGGGGEWKISAAD